MTLTTLVTGASVLIRETGIAEVLQRNTTSFSSTFLILEGLPDGKQGLLDPLLPKLGQVTRLSDGCVCCLGKLPLQVTLNRMLRSHPERLYISIAEAAHSASLRQLLQDPMYRDHLELTADLEL